MNSFTNCIILTPLDPNAGPTGGAGVAFPASICNLIKLLISLSASALPSYFEFQDADVKRFSAWVSADGESADTVAAFEVTDKSGHNKVVSGISSYLTKLTSSFKNTMDSEYQKIQNRILVEDDHIVLLVICDNTGALEPLLNEWQVSPIY